MKKMNIWLLLFSASLMAQDAYLGAHFSRVDNGPRYDRWNGIFIWRVDADSPARQAGLRVNDQLLEVDQNPVQSFDDLNQVLASLQVGVPLNLLIKRKDRTFLVVVEPGLPPRKAEHTESSIYQRYPYKVSSDDPWLDLQPAASIYGVVLKAVGPMHRGQFQVGDQILAFDGHEIRTVADFYHQLEQTRPGDLIALSIQRNDQTLQMDLDVYAYGDINPVIHLYGQEGGAQ